MRYSLVIASLLIAAPALANPFTGKPDGVKSTPVQSSAAGATKTSSAAHPGLNGGFANLPPIPLPSLDGKGGIGLPAPRTASAIEKAKEPELPSYTVMGIANDQVILKLKGSDDTFLVPNHGKTPEGCLVEYPLVDCTPLKTPVKPVAIIVMTQNKDAAPKKKGVKQAKAVAAKNKATKATVKAVKKGIKSAKPTVLKKAAPAAPAVKAAGKKNTAPPAEVSTKKTPATTAVKPVKKNETASKMDKTGIPVVDQLKKMDSANAGCSDASSAKASDVCSGTSTIALPMLPTALPAPPQR